MCNLKNLTLFGLLTLALFIYSCKSTEESGALFEVKNFSALDNWEVVNEAGQKFLTFDYTNALSGFVLPSDRQLEEGFAFEFMLKNNTGTPHSFFYKVYYQNESYKFEEFDAKNQEKQHPLADENFYGSWEDSTVLFMQTPPIPADGKYHKVGTNLRIVGNPRSESRYYHNGINDRWKRNPRVGNYSFMLVVTTQDNIEKAVIPNEVQNICLPKNGGFINPFHFFRYGKGKDLPGTKVIVSEALLNTKAVPDMSAGIYCHPGNFPDTSFHTMVNDLCNCSEEMRQQAAFKQFIHYVDESSRFENIPLIRDVLNEGYTLREYNWNKMFYKREELVSTTPQTSVIPCQNVFYDPDKKAITLMNPKATYGQWKKENAGVRTRHSFTYGTYTLKADLTRLLNNDGVWNGIVNTMWLLNQSNDAWNRRRLCSKEGYLATYWGGANDERVPHVSYSEIDFEILKTVSYCPPHSFPPVFLPARPNIYNTDAWHKPLPEALEAEKDKIIVACTNWDMACWEPEKFDVGCHHITYEGQTFLNHRWDHWYRAITQKSPEPDIELFGGIYFFQIEWKPEEIIWRIGPDKNNLRVVGYMNSTVTSVPNNQMFLIITQEFHNTRWWVGAPFGQEFIPFPKNDIKGYIYEITIE